MVRKLVTMEEKLKDKGYNDEEIKCVIDELSEKEKELIERRKVEGAIFTKKEINRFHGSLFTTLCSRIDRNRKPHEKHPKQRITFESKLLEKGYNDEEIKYAISRLNEKDRELIERRKIEGAIFTNNEEKRFFGPLFYTSCNRINKYRRKNEITKDLSLDSKLLVNDAKESVIEEETIIPNTKEPIIEESIVSDNNKSIENLVESPIEVKDEVPTKQELDKDEYIRLLEYLKTPSFGEMMTKLSAKDAVIISLKLGYVDNKYFPNEAIANFLGIEVEEVIETTKNILLLYKESINNLIDKAINETTKKEGPTFIIK